MKIKRSTKSFEHAAAEQQPVVLRLYVAGSSERSVRAIEHAKEICDEHFAGRYQLDIIDIYTQPAMAKDDHVLAVPMLIKRQPLPVRRFIGDLSNRAVVMKGLAL